MYGSDDLSGELWFFHPEHRIPISTHGRYVSRRLSRKLYGTVENGYCRARFQFGEKFKTFRIHILVCETFYGPKPSSIHQVNHIDGNRSNNHYSNLEWVTPTQNSKDAWTRRKK